MQRTNFDVICASLDRPFIFIAVTNGHPVSANQILQTIEACATRKYANRNVWRLLLCVSKFVFSTSRKRNQTSGQYEVFAQCTVLATHFLYFICLHSIVCCCCCSKDSRSGKLCVYIDHAEQELLWIERWQRQLFRYVKAAVTGSTESRVVRLASIPYRKYQEMISKNQSIIIQFNRNKINTHFISVTD